MDFVIFKHMCLQNCGYFLQLWIEQTLFQVVLFWIFQIKSQN